MTPDNVTPTRCPRCAGTNGNHGEVHVRHGNGGGHNEPCPNAPTPDDAARAEADRLWFSGEHGSPVDWRGGYVRGRADERAQAEGAGSSLSTQEGYEWLVDHDKQVRAHERARIAARRDKVARDACPRNHVARNTEHEPDRDIECQWSDWHTDAVLAALGVSDR